MKLQGGVPRGRRGVHKDLFEAIREATMTLKARPAVVLLAMLGLTVVLSACHHHYGYRHHYGGHGGHSSAHHGSGHGYGYGHHGYRGHGYRYRH